MAAASTEALVRDLAAQAGPGAVVRSGGDEDAVDGVRPGIVAVPATGEGLAAVLTRASSAGLAVRVRGGGTKQDWGAPGEKIDLLLSTAGLTAVVEHRHGDLTATVEAGATLTAVNAVLAAHRQRLPWDPPWPERATVGGIVATNDSGPRRHGHGVPRDSIIGVTMARSDGSVSRAGGIVVKNVAGYDLARLLTGSFGCLGVILTATFKLAPLPPASCTVEVLANSLDLASVIAAELAGSALTPTAVELAWPPPGVFADGSVPPMTFAAESLVTTPARLLVRFESVAASVSQQAREARAMLERHQGFGSAWVIGADRAPSGDEEQAWRWHAKHWEDGFAVPEFDTHGKLRAYGAPGGTLVKLSTVPAELFPTLAWLARRAAKEKGRLEMAVAGRAALGVVDVRLEGPFDAQASVIGDLRERLPVGRGSAVIRRGDPALRRRIDAWGPIGDGMPVMMAVKRQFDPAGLLNAGRGPGGL